LLLRVIFSSKRAQVAIFGFVFSSSEVYIALGPLLILVNSAFVFCATLYFTDVNNDEIALMQSRETYWIFWPLFNPFFVSHNRIVNAVGYAFLIIL